MPTPSGATPDGFAAFLPALAALLLIVGFVVIAFHLPGVKQVLDRMFGDDSETDAIASFEEGPESEARPEGAVPFPGFDPSIYGPIPEPEPDPP